MCVSKYYLKIYFENGNSEILTSGSLEQVDSFIIENNIYDVNDLYEYVQNGHTKDIVGNISFKIEYKYKEQIKEKIIFYKNSLKSFRKNDYISQEIHELIEKDDNFKKKFFAKYFKDILEDGSATPILKHISKYLKTKDQNTFDGFYYACITNKKNKYKNVDNGHEEVEVTYSYTKKRNFFEFINVYKRGKDDTQIYIQKEDEFDEQFFHDQNPDMGLRIPEVKEPRKYLEDEEIEGIKSVKKLRKTPKIDEKQISLFDN